MALGQEIKEWMHRANRNLRIARVNLEQGFPDAAAFYAQQAAEFALKALQIRRKGAFDRIHDLTKLARDVAAPPAILADAAQVSPAYTAARYPDSGGTVKKKEALSALDAAGRILGWVRHEL